MTRRLRRALLISSAVIVTACVLAAVLFSMRTRRSPRSFLVTEAGYYMEDGLAGHLHRPGAMIDFPFNEHPKGRIVFRTNNLGFREDVDTDVDKAINTVRILVTGDSHTDGVVYNAESFPHLLEENLNAGLRFPRLEVINGGVGYYTFQNYLGFLKKHRYLHPDVFIVTVYLGNDFIEAIKFATERGQIRSQPRSRGYGRRLRQAPAALVSQGGNQLVYFETYPAMREQSLLIARQQFKEIRDICLEDKILLLVVLLPTKTDLEEKARREAADSLRLTDAQLDLNQALKNSLIDKFTQDQVTYLDLTAELKAEKEPLFWSQDYHLNHRGHRRVAEIVSAWLGPALHRMAASEAGR